MDAHLQSKSEEAHEMVRELVKGLPTLPSGILSDLAKLREVEEIVLLTMIDFSRGE